MKYCPTCGKKHENSMRFCTEDGTPLPNVDADAETLKMEAAKTHSPTLYIKTQTVSKGDYVDIALPKFTFRITVKDILETDFPDLLFGKASKELAAYLLLTSPTPLILSNGTRTKRIEFDKYFLPVETGNGENRSLFSFYLSEERVILFRLFVTHINVHSGTVELNWGYFRYSKAGASSTSS